MTSGLKGRTMWIATAVIGISLVIESTALSQALPQATRTADGDGWHATWWTEAGLEADDNIYLLSDGQMLAWETVDPRVSVSRRYSDMNSPGDVIIPLGIGLTMRSDAGLLPFPLEVNAKVEYDSYTRNPKRSYVAANASFMQRVSEAGRIELRGAYVPSRFWKNYLADAVDSTGKVSPDERVYEPGVYSEWELGLEYRHDFSGALRRLEGRILGGYRSRTYDDPFPGRDQLALSGGAELICRITDRWKAEASYVYEYSRSPVTPEVLILDEPDFMLDFNNDLDVADKNLRMVTAVDRSRGEGLFALATTVEPWRKLEVKLSYGYRQRDYTSQEPLDPSHRARVDRRNELQLGIGYNLMKPLMLKARYVYQNQISNVPFDPDIGGETTDYVAHAFTVGVQWRF